MGSLGKDRREREGGREGGGGESESVAYQYYYMHASFCVGKYSVCTFYRPELCIKFVQCIVE